MKITTDKSLVESCGVKESNQFSIKATPKSFNLLISQLYSDRISAFVRELSTNAYEAHQMVGKENVPFDVHFPTFIEKFFRVRDYGPGLDKDEVRNIYTVIFESTKTNSNDFGGCFGLGSKSPFAYTSNFSVTSYKNGIQYNYAVYKDEEGYPKMDLLLEEPTDKENGVEVTIPIHQADITLVNEAVYIYDFFKTVPNINISHQKPSILYETDNFAILEKDRYTDITAVMGNIRYHIDYNQFGIRDIYNLPIVMKFDIGELSPDPSRERLSYDKRTIKNINTKASLVRAELEKKAKEEIDKCDCFYKVLRINKSFGIDIFRNLSYNNIKISDYDTLINNDSKFIIKFKSSDRRVGHYPLYKNASFYEIDSSSPVQRMKKHSNCEYVIAFKPKKGHTIEDFCKTFYITPDMVVKTSSIEYTKAKTQTIRSCGRSIFRFSPMTKVTDCWDFTDSIPDGAMYVPLSGYSIDYKGFDIKLLQLLIKHTKYEGDIYGIRKSGKVPKNYRNFIEYAKDFWFNNQPELIGSFREARYLLTHYEVSPIDLELLIEYLRQSKIKECKKLISVHDSTNNAENQRIYTIWSAIPDLKPKEVDIDLPSLKKFLTKLKSTMLAYTTDRILTNQIKFNKLVKIVDGELA